MKKTVMEMKADIATQREKLANEKHKRDMQAEHVRAVAHETHEMELSAVKMAAATGDIAVNPSLVAHYINYHTKDDGLKRQGVLYQQACSAYAELQKSFAAFYQSELFGRMCEDIVNEDFHLPHSLPRLANSGYRQQYVNGTQGDYNHSAKSRL